LNRYQLKYKILRPYYLIEQNTQMFVA
jgi:hypothetical protein